MTLIQLIIAAGLVFVPKAYNCASYIHTQIQQTGLCRLQCRITNYDNKSRVSFSHPLGIQQGYCQRKVTAQIFCSDKRFHVKYENDELLVDVVIKSAGIYACQYGSIQRNLNVTKLGSCSSAISWGISKHLILILSAWFLIKAVT